MEKSRFLGKMSDITNMNTFLLLFSLFLLVNSWFLATREPTIAKSIIEEILDKKGIESLFQRFSYLFIKLIFFPRDIGHYLNIASLKGKCLPYFGSIFPTDMQKIIFVIFAVFGAFAFSKNLSMKNIIIYLLVISFFSMIFADILSKMVSLKYDRYYEEHKGSIDREDPFISVSLYEYVRAEQAPSDLFLCLFLFQISLAVFIKGFHSFMGKMEMIKAL